MIASQAIRRFWAAPSINASAFEDTREESADHDYRALEVETWEPDLAERINAAGAETWN